MVKTESTVGSFSIAASRFLIVANESAENKSDFGVKVIIKKSELPNISPVSL